MLGRVALSMPVFIGDIDEIAGRYLGHVVQCEVIVADASYPGRGTNSCTPSRAAVAQICLTNGWLSSQFTLLGSSGNRSSAPPTSVQEHGITILEGRRVLYIIVGKILGTKKVLAVVREDELLAVKEDEIDAHLGWMLGQLVAQFHENRHAAAVVVGPHEAAMGIDRVVNRKGQRVVVAAEHDPLSILGIEPHDHICHRHVSADHLLVGTV